MDIKFDFGEEKPETAGLELEQMIDRSRDETSREEFIRNIRKSGKRLKQRQSRNNRSQDIDEMSICEKLELIQGENSNCQDSMHSKIKKNSNSSSRKMS